jgi:uncharacterized repeat protein (TIGR03803 family)
MHYDGVLHCFTDRTNADGWAPDAVLVLSGDTLYGVTAFGGKSGSGTVLALKTDGADFRVLHTFTALTAVIVGGVLITWTNIDQLA